MKKKIIIIYNNVNKWVTYRLNYSPNVDMM